MTLLEGIKLVELSFKINIKYHISIPFGYFNRYKFHISIAIQNGLNQMSISISSKLGKYDMILTHDLIFDGVMDINELVEKLELEDNIRKLFTET